MNVRRYQMGDEQEIIKLYQRVFQKQISYDYWKWKYLEPPESLNPFIFVYEEKGEILGHIGLWVHRGIIKGKEKKVALRIDAMVCPSARGKGIYKILNEQMLKEAKALDISLLYGFPAPQAKRLLEKYIDAKEVAKVNRFVYINRPIATMAFKIKRLKGLTFLDSTYRFIKSLLNKQKKTYKAPIRRINQFDDRFFLPPLDKQIYLQRDATYLNWRYVQHPTKDYKILTWVELEQTKGYLVYCTETSKQGIKVGYILDVIGIGKQAEKIKKQLLQRAIYDMKEVAFIQAWALPNHDIQSLLENVGFMKKDEPMSLVIRTLIDEKVDVENSSNWYLSMGDVDSF